MPTYVCVYIFPFNSKAAFWSRSRMPSPAPTFLEGVPAALQHLTKPALSFLLSPPQNTSAKARSALEQIYLLLGHSEEIFFFFVGSGAIYLGRLSIASLARNPCKTTPHSSHPRTQVAGLFNPWRVSSSTYVPGSVATCILDAFGEGAEKKKKKISQDL